jgi:predicted Zn finger-like uncharacterized protein
LHFEFENFPITIHVNVNMFRDTIQYTVYTEMMRPSTIHRRSLPVPTEQSWKKQDGDRILTMVLSRTIQVIASIALVTVHLCNAFQQPFIPLSVGGAGAGAVRTTRTTTGMTVLQESIKQAEYGVSLELPPTHVRCGKCQTIYAVAEEDLGPPRSRGRRLSCSVCGHSWFQSKDRLMTVRDGLEMVALPDEDRVRIETNLKEGKAANFMGDIKLYVGNIAFECHEKDIQAAFSDIGTVGEVSLVRDTEGNNRGFGFVTMRDREAGQKCIEQLDGSEIRGRKIAVRESFN